MKRAMMSSNILILILPLSLLIGTHLTGCPDDNDLETIKGAPTIEDRQEVIEDLNKSVQDYNNER